MSSSISNIALFKQIEFLLTKAKAISPIYKSQRIDIYWRIGEILAKNQVVITDLCELTNWFTAFSKLRPSLLFFEELLLCYQYYPTKNSLYFELSWTHYQQLIKIEPKVARDFYTFHAAKEGWTVRQLRRQISTRYFERLLTSIEETTTRDTPAIQEPSDVLKKQYLLEFLAIHPQPFLERDLENALIKDLQYFLLELGSGFAFVNRQKRIVAPTGKCFYIDLVFYNYLLRRFILIDLKTGTLTHQDIGQMDMYVRIVDEKWKQASDQPSIGLLLCGQLDETVIRYSAIHDSPQLYAAAYSLAQPSAESIALHQKDKAWVQEILKMNK